MLSPDKPVLSVLLSRQLDSVTTGNDAYLLVLLRAAKRAGWSVRLVFAPTMAFSNRPWLRLHEAYWKVIDWYEWPGSVLKGKTFWSYSPRVWARFARRLVMEAMRKIGIAAKPRSFLADIPWESEARALARAADAQPSQMTVAEYSSMGPMLARVKKPGMKAALLHDLFAARAEAFGASADHETMTFEEEARRCAPADLLIYASLNEAQRFGPLNPGKASVWLRPEVPEHDISMAAEGPARAVFLGTRHGGNLDAVKHLVDDVWPLVRTKKPDAEIWIVGSIGDDLTPEQAASPGVSLKGRVEKLGSIGGAQSIGLAPTRVASGVSIKVAEYLRLGMPTVATPVALEGFGHTLDDLVAIEAGPQAFADRVVALLDDAATRQRMSARGRTEAARRLANDDLAALLANITEPMQHAAQ